MPCILIKCKIYTGKIVATIFWVEYLNRIISRQKYVIGL